MIGSPIPEHEAVFTYLGNRRGPRWYLLVGGWVRGGPYETEDEVDAEIERRYQEMSELYDAVEERARRDGVTVAW